MNWTDERVELLKKLWAEGLSASQIAAQLGGVTRNAVIGKVHRLKLSGRGKTTAASPRAKKPTTVTPAAASAAAATARSTSSAPAATISATAQVASIASTTISSSSSSTRVQTQSQTTMRSTTVTKNSGSAALEIEYEVETATETVVQSTDNVVVPIARRLTLMQLTERTCKWPIGDPLHDDFHFCGHESGESSPYCSYHAKLAFQPSSERRRAR